MISRGADILSDSVILCWPTLDVCIEISSFLSCPQFFKNIYRENDKGSFIETSALKELNNRSTLKRMKETLSDC